MQRITHNGVQLWPKVKQARTKQGQYSTVTTLKQKAKTFFQVMKFVALILFLLLCAATIGYSLHGNTLEAKNTIVLQAAPIAFPILDRIAQAESHSSQYCTKALASVQMCNASEIGSVLVRPNTDANGLYIGNYDIGKYQINSTHLSEAIRLGFDVYTEKDNTAFAQYLFTHEGSEPWKASKKNWE